MVKEIFIFFFSISIGYVMVVFNNIYLIKLIYWDIWIYRFFKFFIINLFGILIDEIFGKCYLYFVVWLKIWIYVLTIRVLRNKKYFYLINFKLIFFYVFNINS